MRGWLALVVIGLVGLALPAQENKSLTLRWFGQSFFQLTTTTGTRIAFDPHAIIEYNRPVIAADLVLVSHLHNDHTQMEAIENRATAKLVLGLKPGGKVPDWNLVDEKFRDCTFRAVGVFHDQTNGMERGKNTAFVVKVDGLTFVHLGDLGHTLSPEQIKKIGPVDVLMIPAGGVYALNGTDAKKVIEQLKPTRFVLPMHYGTKVYEDLLPLDEFLDGASNVKKMQGANELTINPADPAPAQPSIVLLGWKK
jgi:L-ascorbate metabolism protein UlaG (beta-lactamase superfamily)